VSVAHRGQADDGPHSSDQPPPRDRLNDLSSTPTTITEVWSTSGVSRQNGPTVL